MPTAVEQPTFTDSWLGRYQSRGALVMGADYRGLGIVRSLGRRGVPVWVVRQAGQELATLSRYAQKIVTCEVTSERNRLAFFLELPQKHDLHGWMLFPTDDESVGLVARHHAKLASAYQLTTPSWEVIGPACDKRKLNQIADQIQVSHPVTYLAENRADLERQNFTYPVVLKPAIHEAVTPLTTAKAWRVDDRPTLLKRYEEACSSLPGELVMVQELIPGGGEAQFSYAALCDEGEVKAWLCARRTRQYPMDFGRASSFVETVDCPDLVEPSRRLLRELRITGLVEVEYKYDARNRTFKILDVNPRVWGWQSLGAAAGVDFAYFMWLLARGDTVPPSQARLGVKWVRLSTDAMVAWREILRGRMSLRDYFESLRGLRAGAVYGADDPLPGLFEMPLLAYLVLRRVVLRRPV
jgi:predicted ATP-grasp superfamily ATP-dependent carboligase